MPIKPEKFEKRFEKEEEIRVEEEKVLEEDIREKLEKVKETGEPQEIVKEVLGGKIKETIERREVVPEKEFFITKELVFLQKDGKEKSLGESKKDLVFINTLYNHQKAKEMFKWEKEEFWTEDIDMYDEVRDKYVKAIFYGDLGIKGTKLGVRHEVAHTKETQVFTEKLFDVESALGDDLDDARRREKTQPGEILLRFDLIGIDPKEHQPKPVDLGDVVNFFFLKAKSERMAWAKTTQELKEDRKKGIDIEPELQSSEDVERFVHLEDGLGLYERDYSEAVQNKKLREKLKGLFSWKYYELQKKSK